MFNNDITPRTAGDDSFADTVVTDDDDCDAAAWPDVDGVVGDARPIEPFVAEVANGDVGADEVVNDEFKVD